MIALLHQRHLLLACSLTIGMAGQVTSQTNDGESWRTGQHLTKQLGEITNVAWRQAALRSVLAKTARLHRIAIFLDRRIDPNREITFTAEDISLKEFFELFAEKTSLEFTWLGSVAYFGPETKVTRTKILLDIHSDQIRQLPQSLRKRWQRRVPVKWQDLSEPRQLVTQWCEEANIDIGNAQRIPHDLWPAQSLPASSLSERLILVLSGFDQTIDLRRDGSCRVVPIVETRVITRSFPLSKRARKKISDLKAQLTTAKLTINASTATLVGTLDQHTLASEWLQGQNIQVQRPKRKPTARRAPQQGQQIYSLEIKNQPFRAVMLALSKKLDLDVQFDAQLTTKQLSQPISFAVENASLEELFKTAASSAGCVHKIQGRKLTIGRAKDGE